MITNATVYSIRSFRGLRAQGDSELIDDSTLGVFSYYARLLYVHTHEATRYIELCVVYGDES